MTRRPSPPKLGFSLAGFAAVVLIAAGGSLGYWTGTGNGTASASVGSLGSPSITSATAGAGTVALTWTAVTPPGSGTVSYSVSRDGADASGNCPTASAPPAVLSCADSGMGAGTYAYTVTARWRGWTATSSVSNVFVASGGATHFLLQAATTTPTAAVADNLTITALDGANTTVASYAGHHFLTFSGASTSGTLQPSVTDKDGLAVAFGTAVTLTFTNGVATVSGSSNGVMKLYKAESASIVVGDGTISNDAGLAVTVAVGAAAQIALTGSTSARTSGTTRTVTATIQDAGGNTITSGADATRSVTFAQPSGAGTVTGLGSSPATAGFATKVVTGSVAGAVNLQASATLTAGATSSNLLGFTVTAGTATKLGFTQQPGGSTGGVASGTQPVVAVQDAVGNTVTGNTSSVTLALTSAGGATLACSANPLVAAAGVATFAGCMVDRTGSYTLTATDGSLTSAVGNSFTITVGAPAKLGFTQQPSASTGGTAFATQPKVAVQDLGGNTVTGNTSSVTLALTTAGGATLTCTANPLAAAAGVATFAGCEVDLAAVYTLTATDGSLTAAVSNSLTISVGPAAQLAFTQQPVGAITNVALGTQPTLTIRDLGGNAVTTDTSSVTLALTTPAGAVLSCTTNPLAAVAGVATFAGCKVDLPGTYTLTATDVSLTSAVSSSFTITTPASQTVRATGAWNAVDTWTALSLTGTISSATTSATVTGTGTSFLTQVSVGDRILRSDAATSIGIVQSVTSNTSLTLTANASSANTNAAFTSRSIPTATQAVVLQGAFTVTIPTSYTALANTLTFGSSANATLQTITFTDATSTLTTGGDVTIAAPSGSATRNLTVNAGTLNVGGSLNLSAGASGSQANRISRLSVTTGTVMVGGDLVFNKGNVASPAAAQNQIVFSGAGTLNLAGAFTILSGGGTPAGTLTPGTTSTVRFNGGAAQTIPIGVSSITYANLSAANTSAAGATLSAAITATNVTGNLRVLGGTLSNGGFAIALATSKTFEVANGATFKLTGTTGMVAGTTLTKTFGASGTVDYAGAAQSVSNESYGNLSLSGSGAKTLPVTGLTINGNLALSGTATATAGAALTVNGAFSVGSGTTFDGATFSHVVKGAFSNSGTFTASTSTFTLNGTSAQAIGGSVAPTFANLTIANGAGVSLSGVDVTVSGTLALGTSILATGSNQVIASGTVTRTTGFVNGRLQKPIAAGASSPLFEVGTGTTYAPISLALAGASAGGKLTASSTVGQHPSFAGSGISATKYVNRYWTLSAGGGLTATSYTGTFTFVAADLVGTPNTAALVVRRFVGPSTWTAGLVPVSTSTTVAGGFTSSFGDYAAGE